MEEILKSNCGNYIKSIVTPITPYLLCSHYFSTEIYKKNVKYVGGDITQLFTNGTIPNDLYKNKNFDKIKEGDIVQVQVDLFTLFISDILPKISCKIIIFTSQWHLPQLHKNEITDKCLEDEKIILWISQNPIYENHNKYMAFPYGICHNTVNVYMNYMKENYNDIIDINTKDTVCYNSNYVRHGHLPKDHIRMHPIFNNTNHHLPYYKYLNRIIKSKFTISTSGDRDDCYRHYECIGLNSIPISNINYKEIFGNNMIYSDIDEIVQIITGEKEMVCYKIDNNILTTNYWRNKIRDKIVDQQINTNIIFA